MASRDPFEATRSAGGVVSFQTGGAPAAAQVSGVNVTGIQQALQTWSRRTKEREQAEDEQRAIEEATRAQMGLGASGIATPSENESRAYQNAYAARAREISRQQFQADAIRMASSLQREHALDPDGFNAAWQTYLNETVKTIEQRDATFAGDVQVYLDGLGANYSNTINNAVFERDLESQTVQITSAVKDQVANYTDSLLANPSEENFERTRSELYSSLGSLDENAFSPRQIENLRIEGENRLAYAYARGQANLAIADNDYAGAQQIVDELRMGRYFSDNIQGEQLANSIESDMQALRSERNSIIRAGIDRNLETLDTYFTVTAETGSIDEDDLEAARSALNFVRVNGDENDVERAETAFADTTLLNELGPQIRGASPAELNAWGNYLSSPEAIEQYSGTARSALLQSINNQNQQFAQSIQNNDYANVGDPDFRGLGAQQIMNMEPALEDELRVRNRQRVSSVLGVAVDEVPNWTQGQTEDFVQRIDKAAQSGDADAYRALVSRYMRPYMEQGNTLAGARALAATNPEIAGTAFISTALMNATGRDAAIWTNLAMAGMAAGGTESEFQVSELSEDSRNKLDALAEGYGNSYAMVVASLKNVAGGAIALGELDAGADSGEQAKYIDSLLSGIQTTELSNGVSVFTADLGDGPQQQAVSQRAIEETFDAISDGPYDVTKYRPVPVDNNQFIFRDRLTGTILRDDSGAPVRSFVNEPTYERAVESDQQFAAEQARQAQAEAENQLQLSQTEQRVFQHVGAQAGISEDQSNALYRAISTSPARSIVRLPDGIVPEAMPRTDRAGQGGVRMMDTEYTIRGAEALSSFDFNPFQEGQQRSSFVGRQTEMRAGTVMFYADMLDQFGGDTKKALAAVAASPEDVQLAVDNFGEDWLDEMPDDTRRFVRRGLPNAD